MFKNFGLLFLIKPPDELDQESLEFFKDLNFKNFIFFKEHFEEGNEVIRSLKENIKVKLLAVDQEGGRVCRIKGNFASPLEVAKKYLKTQDKNVVKEWAKSIALTLKKYELNLNLAPCVDLAEESAEEFLKSRTFSSDPEIVKKLAQIFIKEHEETGVFTCIKHFPGLKEVKIDPHIDLPFKISFDENLKVFENLIKDCGIRFLMTTHLVIREVDINPVTFSEKVVKFLRKEFGYRGFILTDDLNMGALKKWELEERIILGVVSGHNLLIYCGDLKFFIKAFFNIKSEIEKSKIIREKVQETLFLWEFLWR
jgi:beta-N-acetylhexosaminidase